MPQAPVFHLHQVSKAYSNGVVALQGLNFTVNRGEFVSLVGASGCGKSTVLRLVANLLNITEGEIEWSDSEPQQKLAFVFQQPALLPWATVFENIRLPLKLAGMSRNKSRTKVQEAIHLVGLTGFESAYPRQLSGGMKMRVSLARALVTDPQLLLMDEPFGALDELTRTKLNHDLLRLAQQQHWTVLFVTHNLYEAVYLSHRVLVMSSHPGQIVAEVPIDVAYPRPEDFRLSRPFHQYCDRVAVELTQATQGQY
ncbi:ABC transporter ATP-binding protein [Spirulina subsalsa]|nr:ABC transporter ATP-binding protein [Spirulina subsalsa]